MVIEIVGRPISKKNSRRLISHHGRPMSISSKAYLEFEESALWQLKAYKERHKGPVDVVYTFEMKGKLDADCDNLIGGINDILEKSGIIDNDKNIVSGSFVKYHGFKDWRTMVRIEEVK